MLPIAPCFYSEVQIHQDAVSTHYALEIPWTVNAHVQGIHLLCTCWPRWCCPNLEEVVMTVINEGCVAGNFWSAPSVALSINSPLPPTPKPGTRLRGISALQTGLIGLTDVEVREPEFVWVISYLINQTKNLKQHKARTTRVSLDSRFQRRCDYYLFCWFGWVVIVVEATKVELCWWNPIC